MSAAGEAAGAGGSSVAAASPRPILAIPISYITFDIYESPNCTKLYHFIGLVSEIIFLIRSKYEKDVNNLYFSLLLGKEYVLLSLKLFCLQAIKMKRKQNIYLSEFDWLLSKGFCSKKAWSEL